jgi:hypothetical protein
MTSASHPKIAPKHHAKGWCEMVVSSMQSHDIIVTGRLGRDAAPLKKSSIRLSTGFELVCQLNFHDPQFAVHDLKH